MPAMTEAFRSIHREVWEEYQRRVDAISVACREAESPLVARRNDELLAEDKRHSEAGRAIYKKFDTEIAPVRWPFQLQIDAVIAEREVAIKALKAKHGVA